MSDPQQLRDQKIAAERAAFAASTDPDYAALQGWLVLVKKQIGVMAKDRADSPKAEDLRRSIVQAGSAFLTALQLHLPEETKE